MLITMTSTTPLLMHNIRLADDHDPYVISIKKLTALRTKKTNADKMDIDRLSFLGGMYYDKQVGVYLPAENVFRSFMEAGAQTRSGKKVERGVIFKTDKIPLQYNGPVDPEELWGNGDSPFVDRRMVTVDRKRIPRVRPIFSEWGAEFEAEIDDTLIDLPDFVSIVEKAGRMIGVGDYRRFYGKFVGEVTE